MRLAMRAMRLLPLIAMVLAQTALTALVQPAGTQMVGTVATVADDTVTLTEGASFGVTDQTRVTRVQPATLADLSPGQYVQIAASREADGVLNASVVNVFPEASRGVGEGQREMIEIDFCLPLCQPRDLMTNATVDEAQLDAIDGAFLTISYRDETSVVRATLDTRIGIQSAGSLADVAPGVDLIGFVNPAGVAGSIWVYMT